MRLDPLVTLCPVTGATRALTSGLLAEVYLAPYRADWPLSAAMLAIRAPWSDSLSVAPEETAQAVEAALVGVIRATGTLRPESLHPERLPEGRARQHLTALHGLWQELGGALPEDLAAWRHVLGSTPGDALEALPLLGGQNCPHADPVERELLRVLLAHHGLAPDAARTAWLARQPARGAIAPGALGHVQAHLHGEAPPVGRDETLSVFGVRDPNEEAELAAGLVQRMLDDGKISSPAEAGLLIPEDIGYRLALARAFDRCGLPLTDQPQEPARLDHAGVLLSALLAVLKGPAPRTALATIHASPLMPWPVEAGRRMAREIIERGYSRTARGQEGQGRLLLDALRPASTRAQLFARLSAVAGALPSPETLRPRIEELSVLASGEVEQIDWSALIDCARPRPVAASGPDRFVEGVTLLPELDLPWRPVRQLIVLGMAGRQWPRQVAAEPMFTEGERALIRTHTGLALPSRADHLARRLELFRRQLCTAAEGATLLVPARDLAGEALPFSTGLALISRLLGENSPEKIVEELRGRPEADWPTTRTQYRLLPDDGAPVLPEKGRLSLDVDLLTLRAEQGGTPPPQSPSRLETLLVSPFAWLLDELGAKDRTWAPEALDVLTLGTLIHGVLERVFLSDVPAPDPATAPTQAPAALEAAIKKDAPWLAGGAWSSERASLLREAELCVAAWARFLRDTGAEVLSNEVSLAGEHHGLQIAGRADTVLRLPDGRLMIVDHKRSSSEKRRKRMSLGWDLQVALYRAMLEHPEGESDLSRAVASGAPPITAYHLTRDGVVLVDETGVGITSADYVGEDASGNALAHLIDLLHTIRGGQVALNFAGDAKRFDKERGLPAYALQDNELVAAFLLPEPEEDVE